MYYYRVTKYDPAHRDEDGRYMKNEWISVYDIGRCFDGETLTAEEYLSTEEHYIEAVLLSMQETGVETFKVTGLEKNGYDDIGIFHFDLKHVYESLQEGLSLSGELLKDTMKLILREVVWAKLESNIMNVHFGYDYYMYICSKKPLEAMKQTAQNKGLFVENIKSPYCKETE